MKNCLLVFTLLWFTSLLQANNVAIKICNAESKSKLLQLCKNQNLVVKEFSEIGYIMVDADILNITNLTCFVSRVREHEQHIAFNTNTILLKIKSSASKDQMDLISKYNLTAHAFIPNFFLLESTAKDQNELDELLKRIKQEPLVAYAGINQVFTLEATTNDPLYNRQWSIENTGSSIQSNGTPDADMQVDSAWMISTGANTKVAILDSGVDTLHEDLIDNILTGFDGFNTDSTDTKGFPTPNYNSDGHGTACAGIVGAVSDNSIGLAGIANQSKIVPVRIFYYKDYGGTAGVQATTNTLSLLSGTAYAWRVADADVVSTSAGLSQLFIGFLGIDTQIINQEIREAFAQGRNGYGVAMFFSAGNDNFNDVLWPGDLAQTIAIGASSMCDERKNPNDCSTESWGSSYGLMLDVVAPGVRITTCDMTGSNGYSATGYTTTFNGTSASCPNAAGVGALIIASSPGLHARDVKAILNITADRVGGYNYDSLGVQGTWNEEMGHGRINAYKAVQLALTYTSTVSINSIQKASSFSVHPNPAQEYIKLTRNDANVDELLLINMLGELIYTFRIEGKESHLVLPKELAASNYFLLLKATGESIQITKD